MKRLRGFGVVVLCLGLLLASTGCGASGEPPGDGVTTDTTPPTSPPNLTMTTPWNDNTPTFTWETATDDDSGIDYYLVSMDYEKALRNVGDVTTYTWRDALYDGSHAFQVRAVDKAGNEGPVATLWFSTGLEEEYVSETGTVTFITLEGGFYGIVSQSGKGYDPINLGEEYRIDGLQVAFVAKVRRDLGSCHMWGTIIEITWIEKSST